MVAGLRVPENPVKSTPSKWNRVLCVATGRSPLATWGMSQSISQITGHVAKRPIEFDELIVLFRMVR